jgi:hypothetical protein
MIEGPAQPWPHGQQETRLAQRIGEADCTDGPAGGSEQNVGVGFEAMEKSSCSGSIRPCASARARSTRLRSESAPKPNVYGQAQASGDLIAAEGYQQYAEHHYRLIAAARMMGMRIAGNMPLASPLVRQDVGRGGCLHRGLRPNDDEPLPGHLGFLEPGAR